MPDCAGTTKKDKPCGNQAKRGERLCAAHLGQAHRPTKLNEDLTHQVAALLRNGNYIETACLVAGISPTSYYLWRERGEADQDAGVATVFSEFLEATTRARAEGKAMLLQMVRQAAQGSPVKPGDWRAAAWILERTCPEEFGPRQEVRHSGAMRTDAAVMPDDEDRLREVMTILADIGVLGEIGGEPDA